MKKVGKIGKTFCLELGVKKLIQAITHALHLGGKCWKIVYLSNITPVLRNLN